MFCISTALARTSSLVYKLSGMFSPFFINFWLMQRTFIIRQLQWLTAGRQ